MGTSNSKHEQIKINHQRFKNIQIKSSQIVTKIPVDINKQNYTYWIKKLQQLKNSQNSSYLFLPKQYPSVFPQASCACSKVPQIKLIFELYPYILQDEISLKKANSNFEQAQLWLLLYSLLKSLRAFEYTSQKVGDIHPHNIFLNDQGYPKLACQYSFPNEQTNYQKMFYHKTFRYLAPQEIQMCQRGEVGNTCFKITSQAFSVGMTMLAVGLLDNLDKMCDMRNFQFNLKYFQFIINKWMNFQYEAEDHQIKTYSQQLKSIVRDLCCINLNQRLSPSKIYESLSPYQQKIMKLEPFVFKWKQPDQVKNYQTTQISTIINDQLFKMPGIIKTNQYQLNQLKNEQTDFYSQYFNKYSKLNNYEQKKNNIKPEKDNPNLVKFDFSKVQLNRIQSYQQIKQNPNLELAESINYKRKIETTVAHQSVNNFIRNQNKNINIKKVSFNTNINQKLIPNISNTQKLQYQLHAQHYTKNASLVNNNLIMNNVSLNSNSIINGLVPNSNLFFNNKLVLNNTNVQTAVNDNLLAKQIPTIQKRQIDIKFLQNLQRQIQQSMELFPSPKKQQIK